MVSLPALSVTQGQPEARKDSTENPRSKQFLSPTSRAGLSTIMKSRETHAAPSAGCDASLGPMGRTHRTVDDLRARA